MKYRTEIGTALRAIAAAALTGCGWPSEGGGWELPTCTNDQWTPLGDLTPDEAIDGMRLLQGSVDGFVQALDERGAICGGATDPTACAEAVEAASAERFDSHVVTTAGDTVQVWADPDEIRALIGSVDHPSEAMLLAWAEGDFVRCDDLSQGAMRVAPGGGFDVVTTSYREICAPIVRVRTLRHVSPDGEVEVVKESVVERSSACIGRRPDGLGPAPCPPDGDPGRWLAEIARLEAASVVEFERLAVDLAALGAPEALVAGARSAAHDERRHAVAMGALARRHGAEPGPVEVDTTPARDLRALALHNATEGCVRETFGALLGLCQAERATDPAVARAMRTIAADEVRHAELSWRIAAWAEPRLTPTERRAVARARQQAFIALRAAPEGALAGDPQIGLPDGPTSERLLDGLAALLAA